jgi:hypothetical protein
MRERLVGTAIAVVGYEIPKFVNLYILSILVQTIFGSLKLEKAKNKSKIIL